MLVKIKEVKKIKDLNLVKDRIMNKQKIKKVNKQCQEKNIKL